MKSVFILILLMTVAFCRPSSAQPDENAGFACTQMWCQEGFTLILNGSDWPPGAYTFTVTGDGKKTACISRLPFTGCEGNTKCDAEGVIIGESGCAMGPETHSFYAVMMPATPQAFSLAIEHESGKTFTYNQEAVPMQCSYPNGERCDPRPCCSANLSADVTWR